MASRPDILVILPYLRPGLEATGPNQSVSNMIMALSDRYRFRVIAQAVQGEPIGSWHDYQGIERLALPAGRLGPPQLAAVLNDTPHDLVMVNSFHDPKWTLPTLLLRRRRRAPQRPMLLAPRGEFAPAALAIKPRRKRAYRRFVKAAGLLEDVTLQVTDAAEAADARRWLGDRLPLAVTPNIRLLPALPPHQARRPGEALRVAFLARIVPIKNLPFALERLAEASVPVRLDLYGPYEVPAYQAVCEAKIAALPPHVTVHHHGSIPNADVVPTMARHDLLFLPTQGENFGHSIVDALVAGTPVLISDRTPWRKLERSGAGWDLSLTAPAAFVDAIRTAATEAGPAADARRLAARRYIEGELGTEQAVATMSGCLDALISRGATLQGAGAVGSIRLSQAEATEDRL